MTTTLATIILTLGTAAAPAAPVLTFEAPAAPLPPPRPQLHALDCGRVDFADLGEFADTGEYEGKPGTLMASCFLIRHPKGTLLWDAGLGDRFAEPKEGTQLPSFKLRVPKTLASQLAQLGLSLDDVTHFAFSHGHADHLGNANALKRAVWLVDRREHAWLTTTHAPPRTQPALIAQLSAARSVMFEGDYDVFGDGSVRILSAPGHTPGHQVLLVRLERAGHVLLSGDLFHSHANRRERRMPVFNVSRADTLASIDRIERIVARTRARVVIQHVVEDFAALPQLPHPLD